MNFSKNTESKVKKLGHLSTFQREYNDNTYLLDTITNDNIKRRIDYNLKWYISKAVKAKRWYYILSAATIVAPIISGIIISINTNKNIVNLISAFILALSSISASFLNLFDLKMKWSLYRNQAEEIKRFLVFFSTSEEMSEFDLLKAIEESIQKTDRKWTDKLKKE